MADCENLVLSSVLNGMSYDDMLFFNGLGNVIYKARYAKTDIRLVTGRTTADHLKLLNELPIEYHEISLDEICNGIINDNSKVIAVIPKVFLTNDVKPKENFIVFNPYYSMFEVTDIDNELITFKISAHSGNNDNTDELILKKSKSDLALIEKIKTTPFDYAFKFIAVKKMQQFNNNFIISHMKENLKKCLVGEKIKECGMIKISGKKFYDEFYNILKSWKEYNTYQKKFLIMSIQAGSTYFYRHEFADALLRKTNIQEDIAKPLYTLGDAYRKIKHLLKGEFNLDEAMKLLDYIKKEEMATISRICDYKLDIC